MASSIINVHQPGGEGRQEQPQPGPCALGASPSSVPPAPAAPTLLIPSPPALSKSPPKLKNIPKTPGRASIKNWACLGAREDGAELPQPLPTLLWGWKYGEGAPPPGSGLGNCLSLRFLRSASICGVTLIKTSSPAPCNLLIASVVWSAAPHTFIFHRDK